MRRLSLLLLFLTNVLLSQNLSPTAASLGVYNEIPVSYFTGIPDISIPLTKHKELLPINLSYHIQSIRPSSLPGQVGLGWSLQVGGVITRVVKGIKDEEKNNCSIRQEGEVGCQLNSNHGFYRTNRFILHKNDWYSTKNIKKIAISSHDYSPDEFYFNFMGKAGKFMIDEYGKFQIIDSSEPLKVEVDHVNFNAYHNIISIEDTRNNSPTFNRFTITDSKGVRYVFGGLKAMEFSLDFDSNGKDFRSLPSSLKASSWFLEKILYPNSEVISFEYERLPLQVNLSKTYINRSLTRLSPVVNLVDGDCLTRMHFNKYHYTGSLIFGIHLKSVKSKLATVNFEFSNSNQLKFSRKDLDICFAYVMNNDISWFETMVYNNNNKELDRNDFSENFPRKKLNEINILSNQSGRLIRKINFKYTDTDSERLKLDEIKITGKYNKDEKTYSFFYNRDMVLDNLLPSKLDHWGYLTSSSSKEPSLKGSESEILEKIVYPTKGSVNFEYELNSCSKLVNTNGISPNLIEENRDIGGVRIKKIIKNYDVEEEVIDYSYKNNGKSSGELSGIPIYNHSGEVISNSGVRYLRTIAQNIPLYTLSSNSMGNYVGYSKVTETSDKNGEIEYFFTNYSDTMDEKSMNSLNLNNSTRTFYSRNNKMRGKLYKKKIFNNKGKVLKEEFVEYKKTSLRFIKSLITNKEYYCDKRSHDFILYGFAKKHYLYQYLPSRKRTIVYSPSGNLTTTEEYKYNDKGLPSEVKTKDSNNRTTSNSYRYVSDIPKPWPQPVKNAPYQRVLQYIDHFNMINYPIEETQSVNGRVTGSKLYNYDFFGGSDSNIKVSSIETLKKPSNESFVKAHFPNNSNTLPFKKDSNYTEALVYHSYDDKGNPLEVSKKDGTHIVYIWGYNKTKLIAKIENCTYSEVDDFLDKEDDKRISFLQDLSNKDKDKASEKSLRDWLNKLREIVYDRKENTQVTTYTYDPLIGVTSITDSRGETVYYEYDDFNRLQYVKDGQGNILKEHKYNYKNN